MWILILIAAWWLFGGIGYFLLRQGFLVEFEQCLGTKKAWGNDDALQAIFFALTCGPLFIVIAFSVEGKFCLKKRKLR